MNKCFKFYQDFALFSQGKKDHFDPKFPFKTHMKHQCKDPYETSM